MRYDQMRLRKIYDSTAGRCHLCRKQWRLDEYGKLDGWEVDHSRARAAGGTDHGNNLRPACVSCNRSRQDLPVSAVRAANGVSRPPVSAARRSNNEVKGAIVGGLGAVLLGLTGLGPILIVAGIGAVLAADD